MVVPAQGYNRSGRLRQTSSAIVVHIIVSNASGIRRRYSRHSSREFLAFLAIYLLSQLARELHH